MSARFWLLIDSRSPAGGHSHSGGMEAAITAGWVQNVADVREFCRGRLRTNGRVAAAFAGRACELWLATHPTVGPVAAEHAVAPAATGPTRWADLDAEFDARTPSEAARAASRALGNGLRRLLRATVPDADLSIWAGISPHHPIVLGVGAALTGATPEDAGRAAALAACTAPASAAVRLLGLDPYAVHAILAELAPEIDATTPEGLPADGAPALDLLADVHLTQEVRLFAS